MSCCGSRRQQFWAATQPTNIRSMPVVPAGPAAVQEPVRAFVYEGLAAITVIGHVTGKRYAFPHAGAHIAVDPRDAPFLRSKPVVRRS
jgi:hypothetical protein